MKRKNRHRTIIENIFNLIEMKSNTLARKPYWPSIRVLTISNMVTLRFSTTLVRRAYEVAKSILRKSKGPLKYSNCHSYNLTHVSWFSDDSSWGLRIVGVFHPHRYATFSSWSHRLWMQNLQQRKKLQLSMQQSWNTCFHCSKQKRNIFMQKVELSHSRKCN